MKSWKNEEVNKDVLCKDVKDVFPQPLNLHENSEEEKFLFVCY